MVERVLPKDEVAGPNPVCRSKTNRCNQGVKRTLKEAILAVAKNGFKPVLEILKSSSLRNREYEYSKEGIQVYCWNLVVWKFVLQGCSVSRVKETDQYKLWFERNDTPRLDSKRTSWHTLQFEGNWLVGYQNDGKDFVVNPNWCFKCKKYIKSGWQDCPCRGENR